MDKQLAFNILELMLDFIKETKKVDSEIAEHLYSLLIGLLISSYTSLLLYRAALLAQRVSESDTLYARREEDIKKAAKLGREVSGVGLRADYAYVVTIPMLIGVEVKRGVEIKEGLRFQQLLQYLTSFDLVYYVFEESVDAMLLERGLSSLGAGIVHYEPLMEGDLGGLRKLLSFNEPAHPPAPCNSVLNVEKSSSIISRFLKRIIDDVNIDIDRQALEAISKELVSFRAIGMLRWRPCLG